MHIPHLHTPHSHFLFNLRLPVEEFAEAAVCVVQRQALDVNKLALDRIRALEAKIVYDLDDNLWNLPGANPGKETFENLRRGFDPCMEASDVLTVSTPGLRTAVRTSVSWLKKEIVVVPNAIDFGLCPQNSFLPRDPTRVVVGWSGSATHAGDIGAAWRAVAKIAKRQLSGVFFVFVGMAPPKEVVGLPNVIARSPVPVAEFFARWSTWAFDIVLGPLDDNRFNRSKSNIRMLESAAVGAPCLVSPVGPYRDFCALDPELKYLQCTTESHWESKLLELIADQAKRVYYAERMLTLAKKHFSIENVISQWHEVFREVAR